METTNKRGISAAVLKNIAVLTMTIDHVTAFLLKQYLYSHGALSLYSSPWYCIGRGIGRIAFVLYAFMLAEGAYRTGNKTKYALRLLILAVISIIPYSYCNTGRLFNPENMNIFFLLFLGLLTIYAWEWIKKQTLQQGLSVLIRILLTAASCAVAEVLKFDYGMMGILLILVFYVYRYDFPKLAVAGVLVLTIGYMIHAVVSHDPVGWIRSHSSNLIPSLIRTDNVQVYGVLALPLIYFYNGSKGRQLSKWFYYLYYPVHLGIIALILMIWK